MKSSALALSCLLILAAGTASPRAAPERTVSVADNLRPAAFVNRPVGPKQPIAAYALGEPVYLYVILANWSRTETFSMSGAWHPANDLEITITPPKDLPRRFTAGAQGKMFPTSVTKIGPRDMTVYRVPLVYEPATASGFAFDQPGRYTITTRMTLMVNDVPQTAGFPKVELTILPASPKVHEALDLFMRPECAEDLQRGYARAETAATWQELIERYPGSGWAPHAKILLAWRAWRDSAEDYTAIAKRFEAILAEHRAFLTRASFADEAYYGCVSALDRAGKPLEALEWIRRLQREFPNSHYIRGGSALLQKYIQKQDDNLYAPWFLSE